MDNARLVGHIVSVHGYRVKVELLPDVRSAMRTSMDGVQAAIAINSYLAFSLGAGETVIGIITDLEARETFDPSGDDALSLELMKPRRIAIVQLLGTIFHSENIAKESRFSPGISVLPTLDTPAETCSPLMLSTIFKIAPKRNKPQKHEVADYDFDLVIGHPTSQPHNVVCGSYNDLFSRPLAIVGNTGSGKSFTVSSIIQKAMEALGDAKDEPHVFILDINGEYGKAFPNVCIENPLPDRIYLNGEEFSIPLWCMNAEEICAWLSASEQTQEPVLKDWWAIAKGGDVPEYQNIDLLQDAMNSIDHLINELGKIKRKYSASYCDAVIGYLKGTEIDTEKFKEEFDKHQNICKYDQEVMRNQAQISVEARKLKQRIRDEISNISISHKVGVRTADSPYPISRDLLNDPSLLNRAISKEDTFRIDTYLTTLRLRLRTRLDDKRWHSFLNYEDENTKIESLIDWFQKFGLGQHAGPKVSVIDLSMLSNEVLPYSCALIGRLLLEARERLPANSRYKNPWVLVLEEAHNYAQPVKSNEDSGHRLARLCFERIAKEGRKFGFSLIIASQRPSEISQTIISQCANFISHRLQNPDDIDHFRRIIPMQARRLLDQVTILSAGEAIVFGSAFHIPTRVAIDLPEPGPYSQTAAPYYEWSNVSTSFPLSEVISMWMPHTNNNLEHD